MRKKLPFFLAIIITMLVAACVPLVAIALPIYQGSNQDTSTELQGNHDHPVSTELVSAEACESIADSADEIELSFYTTTPVMYPFEFEHDIVALIDEVHLLLSYDCDNNNERITVLNEMIVEYLRLIVDMPQSYLDAAGPWIPDELKDGFYIDVFTSLIDFDTTITVHIFSDGSTFDITDAAAPWYIVGYMNEVVMQYEHVALELNEHQAHLDNLDFTLSADALSSCRCTSSRRVVTSTERLGSCPTSCHSTLEQYILICNSCGRQTGWGSRFIFGPRHDWVAWIENGIRMAECRNCRRRG